MANVFFFSERRPQAPFSSVFVAAEAAAPLRARWSGEQGERDNILEVVLTAMILKLAQYLVNVSLAQISVVNATKAEVLRLGAMRLEDVVTL